MSSHPAPGPPGIGGARWGKLNRSGTLPPQIGPSPRGPPAVPLDGSAASGRAARLASPPPDLPAPAYPIPSQGWSDPMPPTEKDLFAEEQTMRAMSFGDHIEELRVH